MGAVLIGVVPSPPEVLPRSRLYVTPLVVLAFQLSSTECVPVPERLMVVGEPVALLATLTFAPVTAPPFVGENVTVRVTDCPGIRTVPFDTPLTENPAPVVATAEIVMFELPLFVSTVGKELVP
jgi:hypothetical protein